MGERQRKWTITFNIFYMTRLIWQYLHFVHSNRKQFHSRTFAQIERFNHWALYIVHRLVIINWHEFQFWKIENSLVFSFFWNSENDIYILWMLLSIYFAHCYMDPTTFNKYNNKPLSHMNRIWTAFDRLLFIKFVRISFVSLFSILKCFAFRIWMIN